MPRASNGHSDGKKQLSIAQFLKRPSPSNVAGSPNRYPAPSSPQARPSPRKLLSPAGTSPRSSPLPRSPRAQSPRSFPQQFLSSNTSSIRSPRTLNVDREGPPPQLSPRKLTSVAGISSGRPLPRKNTSSRSDEKIRMPKGRPLDHNMQMILVTEDTIPELMEKLKYVDAADLGCEALSDEEEEMAHAEAKGSVTTRRTRVLKGVKLDKTFEPPSHYIRTREVVDTAQITEYDMDSDDCHFVQKYNQACEDGKEVTFNVFEILIDRLEKELMIRLEASQSGGHSSSERLGVRGLNTDAEHVTLDEAVCAVCQYDDSYDDNLIIVCDGCDVAVHQVCYGVKKVPTGAWLCDPCSHGQVRNPKPPAPVCCLCHKKEGAFKITDDGRWAHIMCAIWIPQTCVQNNETMCPIVGIDSVPQETWQMRCEFCRCQGACIRCGEAGCTRIFHPVCARSNGCVMDIGEGDRGEIEYRATCPQHSEFASSNASSFAVERSSQEVVLDPQTIRDLVPIQKVFVAFQFKPHIVRCIYDYWVEKRARCCGSLLARFYTFPEGYFNSYRDEKTRKTNVITLMKKAIKLREEWESLRILLDVVRQREKRKLALLKLQQEIVEEEVVVGWRNVQKARVSVAAKWKVRPVKLQAVRAHHNFRSSSGSDSDESDGSATSRPSSAISEDDISSLSEAGAKDDSDEEVVLSSSSENASSIENVDVIDFGTRAVSASAFGNAGPIGKARSDSEILEAMQRCALWIQRSTGIKTKKLSERMLAGYGRGRRGGARAEWCRLCAAVVRFNLGTAVQGEEGMESGSISLAPGVTLGSLQQYQLPVESVESIQSNSLSGVGKTGDDHADDEDDEDDEEDDELSTSGSNSSDMNTDDQEISFDGVSPSEKRKTRSEADKVSLELRGLGVKDSRAARQLASNDARPSRFGKHPKRAKF